MENDQLQQQEEEYVEGDVAAMSPLSAAASGVNGWKSSSWLASHSYSRVLSNSMKKIMTSRPRMMATMKSSVMGSHADDSKETSGRKNELELFAQFASAVDRKDKEEMITMLTQHPQLMRITNEDDQLALHLVCGLVPNYFYVDLMNMMVQGNDESPASMNKAGQTPLHVLCLNPSVTRQGLAVLLAGMPASEVMCDKHSSLAIHYLCSNTNCELQMLQQLCQQDTYAMKNAQARTPLHLLAMKLTQPKVEAFVYLLECCPEAAAATDIDERSVLHWICESDKVTKELLTAVLAVAANAPCKPDIHLDLPLHLLCQNGAIDVPMLKKLLQANPNAATARTENDLTALHFLCANDAVSADLVAEFLAYDKLDTTPFLADTFGAMPLHLLCVNEAVTAAVLRVLLLVCPDDSFAQDVHGRSPLHYLCMNRAITSELVWLFLERTQDLVREIDSDGKTPLHHLCANQSVTAVTLEILFDACPSAAMVADKELRLPIQYLADNPSSPSEMTALLISGPASYRLRYDFLSVVGSANAVSYMENHELVYVQTHLAMDSKTTTGSKVWIKFFSHAATLDHEQAIADRLQLVSQRVAMGSDAKDYAVTIHEDFDDAKRRVSVRRGTGVVAPEDHIADTSVTLHHGLVMEAPLYTLESLRNDKLEDPSSVRAVVSDIGECLAFWHRECLMVHGNVSLECIGQFAQREGLRLLHFHTSREFHVHRHLDVQAFAIRSVPPEAARGFLMNENFEPTAASDIWQFGCLIFQLATGTSLLKTLTPWSDQIGDTQLLHLISALTDDVIQHAIDGVHESFRSILQATLLTNPAQRWTIDRLMHIDAFRGSADNSISTALACQGMRVRLQRHADSELLSAEHQRSAKHANDQLDFIKKEQKLLRAQLLTTKSHLRESEETGEQLRNEATQLRQQLATVQRQKHDALQEVRVFARNHQTMTHQLHTTMQMLINLVPLAQKVYGTSADEFLSCILAQAAGAETTTLSTIDIGGGNGGAGGGGSSLSFLDSPAAAVSSAPSTAYALPRVGLPRRRKSAVEIVKSQLQNSILAHGCIHTWANNSPPSSILEPHELSFGSHSEEDPEEDYSESSMHDENGGDMTNQSSELSGGDHHGFDVVSPKDLVVDMHVDQGHQLKHQEQRQEVKYGQRGGCFLVETDDEDIICLRTDILYQ